MKRSTLRLRLKADGVLTGQTNGKDCTDEKEVGLSVNSYIKKARIDKACYLIVTTNRDIEDISSLLHFGNRNFFTKVFKEETGTTPAEFRKAHKRY